MSAKHPKELTAKQQYWCNQLQLAFNAGQSLSQYAKQHGLSKKALYHYQWLLRKKGIQIQTQLSPAFVKVSKDPKPVPMTGVAIYFPNGVRVELAGYPNDMSLLLHQVQSL